MQDNNALAMELEACPNPWCNSHRSTDPEIRAAEAPILMPSKASGEWCVACPVCPLQSPWQDAEADAVAAWNIRYHKPAPASGEVGELVKELRNLRGDLFQARAYCHEAADMLERIAQPQQPSEDMVGRVARAIASVKTWDGDRLDMNTTPDELNTIARAAIVAMQGG